MKADATAHQLGALTNYWISTYINTFYEQQHQHLNKDLHAAQRNKSRLRNRAFPTPMVQNEY
eukprot:1653062-Amphidinium_carterae.2